MATGRARQICYAGPAFGLLGLAIGYTSLGGLSQGALSLLAASFFLAVNIISDEASSLIVLGSICAALGCLMGAGLAGIWKGDPRMPLFLVAVTLFHATEFTFSVLCHGKTIAPQLALSTGNPAGFGTSLPCSLTVFGDHRALRSFGASS
ncbi:icmt [Symbiodinium natans]|uniref:Icmt protein n=1 Tax=Symbiodinium natans TaxID=878477 RepID=A0A812P3T6_9DINO|nr:icmt [Symbiodinium natans]